MTRGGRRRRPVALLAAAVCAVISLGITGGVATSVRSAASEDATRQFNVSAKQASAAMRSEVSTYFEKLRDIGAFVANAPAGSQSDFSTFVGDTGIFEQLPSLTGVFFLERVEDADWTAYLEDLARDRPDVVVTTVGVTPPGVPHYMLTRYVAGPLDLQLPLYTDITPVTTLTEIIEEAGDRREGAAGSFQNDPLIQEVARKTDFPLIDQLIGVDFFLGMPVFGPDRPDGTRPASPLGWVGAPVDNFEDVVGAVASDLPTGIGMELTIDLTEVSGVDKANLSRAASQEGTAGPRDGAAFLYPTEFSLEGVDWRLSMWSTRDADAVPVTVPIVLIGGTFGSLLAAGLVYLRSRAIDREREHAEELVDREQFQADILDSVTTPLVVLDANGSIVRTNPAWGALVGRSPTGGLAGARGGADGTAGETSGVGERRTEYLTTIGGYARGAGRDLHDALWRVLRGEDESNETDVAFEEDGRRRWFTVRATRLRGRRGGAVVVHTDITERKRSQEDLELKASHDDLTGVLNRAAFEGEMATALRYARAQGSYVGVIFVDLDGFKPINDTYGHAAGDTVLREVARRISTVVRTTDRTARLGGDEFVVLVSPLPDPALIDQTAARVLRSLSQPVTLEDGSGIVVEVMASIGVAVTHAPLDDTGDDLLERADQAMYASKQAGGSRVTRSA